MLTRVTVPIFHQTTDVMQVITDFCQSATSATTWQQRSGDVAILFHGVTPDLINDEILSGLTLVFHAASEPDATLIKHKIHV